MNGLWAWGQQAKSYMEARFKPSDFMLLWLRMWVANVFFMSGRVKTGGAFLTPTDTTVMLFREEYALPLIPPEVAAQLAVYGETFLPLMLMLGLLARVSAAGLFGMTLVIEVFVYPGHFSEHLTWAAALVTILALGAGRVSIDRVLWRPRQRD